jgi:hypothetical protein
MPQKDCLTGPAFGTGYRLIASALMISLTLWGIKLAMSTEASLLNRNLVLLALLAFGLLLYMWWVMMRSVTTLTRNTLSQTWFWQKSASLDQISYVRFMRWRGLEWLIAPRLYVRTGPGPFASYYAASPELWAEFEAMARQLGK